MTLPNQQPRTTENQTTDESNPPLPVYNPYAEQSVYTQKAMSPCDTHGLTTHPGRGLGIAALAAAIGALLLSWIPVVNNLSVILGALGLLLATGSYLRASWAKGNKWWGVVSSVIAVTAMIIGVTLYPKWSVF